MLDTCSFFLIFSSDKNKRSEVYGKKALRMYSYENVSFCFAARIIFFADFFQTTISSELVCVCEIYKRRLILSYVVKFQWYYASGFRWSSFAFVRETVINWIIQKWCKINELSTTLKWNMLILFRYIYFLIRAQKN